jgi:cell division protein FtsW
MLALLVLVPVIGEEVNGARRWLNLGMSLPAVGIPQARLCDHAAWILSWRLRDPNLPVIEICTGLMALIGALLMLQPNLGDGDPVRRRVVRDGAAGGHAAGKRIGAMIGGAGR